VWQFAIRDIQRTNLGQALVLFAHSRDIDNLIHGSLHAYKDVFFLVLWHNEEHNLRIVLYNQEV
jgi:hypothetical protein